MELKEKYFKLILNLLSVFIISLTPLIFWQPFFDPFGPAQLMVIRIFIPICLLVYFIYIYQKEVLVIKNSLFVIPLLIYIIISIISMFFSINKEISLKYLMEIIITIIGAFLIYNIAERKNFKKLIFFLLVIHFIMAIYGLLQHYDMDFFKWNTNFSGRPLGTIGNPDFFANELLLPLFLLLGYMIYEKKYKIVIVISFLIIFLCFIFTKVVGAYIGFFGGVFILIITIYYLEKEKINNLIKKNKTIILILIILFLIVSFIITPRFFNWVKNGFSDKKRSIVHRLLMWEASLLMIKDYPVFGTGIGTYRMHYPYYQGILLNDPENKEYDYVVTWMPHQNYLLVGAETGLAGLGSFLLIITAFFIINYKIFIKYKISDPCALGIFTGIFSLLVASLFNTFYNVPSTTFVFFLFLLLQNMFYKKQELTLKLNKKIILTAILITIITIIYIIMADGKTLLSNVYLKKANKMVKEKNLEKAIDYYKRIISLKPVELTPQMDVGYFYFAAEAYREIGDLKNAMQNYEKDLKINPYCPEVNNMLGATYGQLGLFDDAIKRLKLAVFLAPHYEAAVSNLATAYMAKGDKINAVKILKEFLQKNQKNERIKDMLDTIEKIK